MKKYWVRVYTRNLIWLLDGTSSDLDICNVCDEPWVYCEHTGRLYILLGYDAIEYLLNKLEAI